MRAVSLVMVMAGAGASLGVIACAGGGDDNSVPEALVRSDGGADASMHLDATASGDADGGEGSTDATNANDGQDAGDGPQPTLALLRVANWSADAPAVDFCIAPHGTGAFQGPILAARASAIDSAGVLDAGSGALPFPQASAYLVVDPSQYDARLVAAGSADCASKITSDLTDLPVLTSGGLETIALIGATHPQAGEPALKLVGFQDEWMNSLKGALLIRVINAAADLPKAEVGSLQMVQYFYPILFAVPFGSSSAGDPMADPNGYIGVTPIVGSTLAVRASVGTLLDAAAGTIVAQAPNISLGGGATVTFVVVGIKDQPGPDSGSPGAQLLECIDNAGTPGLAGSCHIISQ